MLILILLVLSSVASLGLILRTIWSLNRYKYRPIDSEITELPSISICIAARNETHALAQCLERVLKSDYQKLEILVLDDSSSDDTSLIIKSFANAGVRFIAGKPLPEGWLGKNHAYQTLIDEASGDYILFLDVDTSLKSSTISLLVSQLVGNRKDMLSVLPIRDGAYLASALLGTYRYLWELITGTKTSPPAASALWIVSQEALKRSGVGLANYSMSVRPERHLARQLQRQKQYYYLIGTPELGVGFAKRLSSQRETAIRLYYPVVGRSFASWLGAELLLLLLLIPIAVLFMSGFGSALFIWCACLLLLTTCTFAAYTFATHSGTAPYIRIALWPLNLLQESILLSASLVTYRAGRVTWKGRPVGAVPAKSDALRIDE